MIARIAQIVTQFVVQGVTAVRRATQAVARDFKKLGDASSNASRRIIGGFAGAARAVTGFGRSLARLAFRRVTIISGAIIGLTALLVKAAGPLGTLVAGLASLGAAGIAGIITYKHIAEVKAASRALAISPELADNWGYIADSIGMSFEDVRGALTGLGEGLYDALEDPASDAARIFKGLGISLLDGNRRIKNSSDLMFEFATQLERLQPAGKAFVLDRMFGADGAAKYAELMSTIARDRQKLADDFEGRKRDGLLITQEQIDALAGFRVGLADLLIVLKTIARELFLAFAPLFAKFMKSFELNFRNPEKRAKLIQDFFVKPFQRAYQLVRDILRVFLGFDFVTALFGGVSSPVVNTWLFRLQWWLRTIWDTATGLAYVLHGVLKVLMDVGRWIDRIVLGATGFSLSTWFNSVAAQDFKSFGADVRKILDDLFAKPIDFTKLETSAGQGLGRFAAFLQRHLGPIFNDFFGAGLRTTIALVSGFGGQLQTAMGEIDAATTRGTGLQGVESTLGKLMLLAGGAAKWLADLATNVERVFVLGSQPAAGFEWLVGLRDALVEADIPGKLRTMADAIPGILDNFEQAFAVLKPFWDALDGITRALFDMSGGAALIVAAFGSLFIKPILLAGEIVGGFLRILGGGWQLLLRFKNFLLGTAAGGWLLAAAKALGLAAGAFVVVYWGLKNLSSVLDGLKGWLEGFGSWMQPVIDGLTWVLDRIESITSGMAGLLQRVPVIGGWLADADPVAAVAGAARSAMSGGSGFETPEQDGFLRQSLADERKRAETRTPAERDAALAAIDRLEAKLPPLNTTPVQINIGAAKPLNARMAPSELDAARAMGLARTSQ